MRLDGTSRNQPIVVPLWGKLLRGVWIHVSFKAGLSLPAQGSGCGMGTECPRSNPISANTLWLESPKQTQKSMRRLAIWKMKDSRVRGREIREKPSMWWTGWAPAVVEWGLILSESPETLGHTHDASPKERRGAFLSYSWDRNAEWGHRSSKCLLPTQHTHTCTRAWLQERGCLSPSRMSTQCRRRQIAEGDEMGTSSPCLLQSLKLRVL